MKLYFFKTLETILFSTKPEDKISRFSDFYEYFLSNKVIFEEDFIPKVQTLPSYAGFCQILHPTRISRPKAPTSTIALAKIIHSIAHIEYSAIDLALDASYRFHKMSKEYYKDWLEVASEEIKHFTLLNTSLQELGFSYGDFPVHQNLFNAMRATDHSISHRMGLVHRALEANGLEANPFVKSKLSANHKGRDQIAYILDIILKDEISHVSKGDKWWKLTKDENEDFISLLTKYQSFSPSNRFLNIKARMEAGYSQKDIKDLHNFYEAFSKTPLK